MNNIGTILECTRNKVGIFIPILFLTSILREHRVMHRKSRNGERAVLSPMFCGNGSRWKSGPRVVGHERECVNERASEPVSLD